MQSSRLTRIIEGTWLVIPDEKSFKSNFVGRVNKGVWIGEGRYRKMRYCQKCPSGCCYDDVVELITECEAKQYIREEMHKLALFLKE